MIDQTGARKMRFAFAGALGVMIFCAALGVPPASAQAPYPSAAANRPVKIVVPFDPGTGPDILARTLGQKLAEKWSIPVVVENRAGASTAIGTEYAAKSTADGYTLMLTANTLVLNRSIRSSLPYDPVKDFAPVIPLAIGHLALVTHPSLGVSTVKDLIAMAKAKPGAIDYGSPGNGTPHHLTMEMFKQAVGISLTHIPYSTTGGAVQNLVGGQIKVMFLPIHVALPHVQAKRLVLLSTGGVKRAEATPDVPSLSEASGVRGIDGDIWYGLYAPAGTPSTVVAKLNADVDAVLRMPEVKATLSRQGLNPTGGSPNDLADLTRNDLEKWTRVVRNAKIGLD